MHVTVCMVSSLNGYTTRGEETNISTWTSPEDQAHFVALKKQFRAIVMGSGTYEAIKSFLQLDPQTLRVVVTSRPDAYREAVVPGQLEFWSGSPGEVVERLAEQGVERLLLVGGSKINAAFLEAGLINELQLTVEPIIFESGKTVFDGDQCETHFALTDVKNLNNQGTLLLIYRITAS